MKILISEIKGFERECTPVWLNTSLLLRSLDYGLQGYFRRTKRICCGLFLIKVGPEFMVQYGDVKWFPLDQIERI